MYDEFFLNNSNDIIKQKSDIDFDIMFNDLSKGVENVNEMISNLNKQKLDNNNEYDEINSEKRKLHKMQEEFETYMRIQRAELKKKTDQTEMDIRNAKQSLENIRSEFKANMDKSLKELEVAREELELEKDKFKETMQEFESYKQLEMDKVRHAEEILKAEQAQLENEKDMQREKLEREKQ